MQMNKFKEDNKYMTLMVKNEIQDFY